MPLQKQSPWWFLPDAACSSYSVTLSHTAHYSPKKPRTLGFSEECLLCSRFVTCAVSVENGSRCVCDFWMRPRCMWLQPRHSGLWAGCSRGAFSNQLPPLEPVMKALACWWSEATAVFSQISRNTFSPQNYCSEHCWQYRGALIFWKAKFGSAVRSLCDRAATQSHEVANVGQPFKQNVTWLTAFVPLMKDTILCLQVERRLLALATMLFSSLGPSATACVMNRTETSELKQV